MPRKKIKSPKIRASWAGMLRFGLVSFPVQAFNAREKDAGHVYFHQLHASCHSRIHYEKHCPLHGKVDNDEIVSGFEYRRGQYVEVEPEELDALRTDAQKSLTIDTFIDPDELDPIYFDGRMYYLAPQGAEAREPYAVFLEALEAQEKVGIGQVVFSGRDQVVLLRPYDGALHMAMLNYAAEMRQTKEAVGELPAVRDSNKKVQLAEQLIRAWSSGTFDFSDYVDTYYEKVKELVSAKIEGREIVAPQAEEEPHVVNFMDALRKSLHRPSRTTAHVAHRKARTTHRHHRRRRAS
jgi:DNA end-binding protein Ku